MLLQIFILEACPDLKKTKGDEKDTHTPTDIPIHVFSRGETEDIWQQTAARSTASKSPTYPMCALSNCFARSIKSPLKRPEPADTRESPSEVICTEREEKRLVHDANIAFSSWQKYSAGVQKKLYAPKAALTTIRFRQGTFILWV